MAPAPASATVLAASAPFDWAGANPILWLFFASMLLFAAALVSIITAPLSGGMKLVWLVFAFVAPVIGSLLWFLVGRGDSHRRRALD